MTHAYIKRDGFKVPLIGIPDASVHDTCSQCGEMWELEDIKLDENGTVLCPECWAKLKIK